MVRSRTRCGAACKGLILYFYPKLINMLRKIFLSLLILALTIPSFSQNFNGGLLFGGNVSQLDGDNQGGYHKFGYLGGGFVSLRVSDHSSFQLEMEYIQKGSRGDTIGVNFLYRFHYLEIPLLYQYYLNNRISLEIGPVADVSLGSLEETNGIETVSRWPLRKVTLAGIFGASVFITNHLKANFRFNYSLLSIRGGKGPYPEAYRSILFEKGQYNNVLSLSLFWYFKPVEL